MGSSELSEAARAWGPLEMSSAYRPTIDEADSAKRGDMQVELESELWRLEQELFDPSKRGPHVS